MAQLPMKLIERRGTSQPLAQKISRLSARLRDPEWRRYGAALLAGKVMGVGMMLVMLNKQVATELVLSEVSLKLHRRHAMKKMQASSLAELVKMCEFIRFTSLG